MSFLWITFNDNLFVECVRRNSRYSIVSKSVLEMAEWIAFWQQQKTELKFKLEKSNLRLAAPRVLKYNIYVFDLNDCADSLVIIRRN
jgi:hypothetical protein